MTEYKIYAGLNGGFGGAEYIETDEFESEEDALEYAFAVACNIYEDYAGTNGIRYLDDIADEEDLDLDEDWETIEEIFSEEREGWLSYKVELV